MAAALLSSEVRDLTLGKPPLVSVSADASVRSALAALKQNDDVLEIGVWDCSAKSHSKVSHSCEDRNVAVSCRCIGKVCTQRIICYLASDASLRNVAAALSAPVTVLLDENTKRVQHIDPGARLSEALNAMSSGAQNLVVQMSPPLKRHSTFAREVIAFGQKPSREHNGHSYCWLTHEDVLRFILGSIRVFSPLPRMSIKDLGVIQADILMVGADEEAYSALEAVEMACLNQVAVAVVDKLEGEDGPFQIVGEISCSSFQVCAETAAIALAILSVHEFVEYTQDWRSTPDTLLEPMTEKLSKRLMASKSSSDIQHKVSQLLHDLEVLEFSSDEELGIESPTGPHDLLHTHHFNHFHRVSRAGYARTHSNPIICKPTSSLIAVLMQALAHREHYVWVTNEDNRLEGMVTFSDILSVLSNYSSLVC